MTYIEQTFNFDFTFKFLCFQINLSMYFQVCIRFWISDFHCSLKTFGRPHRNITGRQVSILYVYSDRSVEIERRHREKDR